MTAFLLFRKVSIAGAISFNFFTLYQVKHWRSLYTEDKPDGYAGLLVILQLYWRLQALHTRFMVPGYRV
ncbi:hypothetical protein AB1Y87_16285, partial [Citrobacter freundii]